jgi:hypothetical protein
LRDCWDFHPNEIPTTLGMLGIAGIWGTAGISTKMSFQQHQGCLRSQGFLGLLEFPPEGVSSNIRDACNPGIWGIAGIFTWTSFQQHQGCLGSHGFEGLLRFPPEQVSSNIRDAWDPTDLRDCWDFHQNEFPATSGMLDIPGIGGIAGISTWTTSEQHQVCLGSQGFGGLLGFPPEGVSSNIRDACNSRDLSDCRDFQLNEFPATSRMLGIAGNWGIAEISTQMRFQQH